MRSQCHCLMEEYWLGAGILPLLTGRHCWGDALICRRLTNRWPLTVVLLCTGSLDTKWKKDGEWRLLWPIHSLLERALQSSLSTKSLEHCGISWRTNTDIGIPRRLSLFRIITACESYDKVSWWVFRRLRMETCGDWEENPWLRPEDASAGCAVQFGKHMERRNKRVKSKWRQLSVGF